MKTQVSRRRFLATQLATVVVLAPAFPAFAKTVRRFYQKDSTGAVLKGYDTIAYFTDGAATVGESANRVYWKGAIWYFATSENADRFRENPNAYAPQFGAYCTRAMSLGKEVPGDPKVWRIHDGKLYVFYASKGGTYFDKVPDEMIKRAQLHWDTLQFSE